MKGRKERISLRWANFCLADCWDSRGGVEPEPEAYLDYINWMAERYAPKLILKICGDLTCQHIKLFNHNPMNHQSIHMRVKIIRYYIKTGRQLDGFMVTM